MILSTDISRITLNAELKNNNKFVDFEIAPTEPLDVSFSWNIPQGYFSIDRSTRQFNFDLKYANTASNLDLAVDGVYTTTEGDGLKIDLNGLESGLVEIDTGKTLTLNVGINKDGTEPVELSSKVEFHNGGSTKLQWDWSQTETSYVHFNSVSYVKFQDFILNFPTKTFNVECGNVKLVGTSKFNLDLQPDSDLTIGGTNQVEIDNLNIGIEKWTGSLGYGNSEGNFDIILQPNSRYYELNMGNKFQLQNFDITYDPDGTTYDSLFSVDDFQIQYGGKTWFKHESGKYKYKIIGNNILNLENLDLEIGSGSNKIIDFSIPSFNIGGDGEIYTELNNQYIQIDADVKFNWDIQLDTLNYGDWELDGSFSGDASLTLNEWTVGQSGEIQILVNSPIDHSLNITHNDLTLSLGDIEINSGSITFDWGTSGNKKVYEIDNDATLNFEFIKISKGSRSISFGTQDISNGNFKIEVTPETSKTTISVFNSIPGFGPKITYKDTSKSLNIGISLTSLNNEITKGVTLIYDESQKKISIDSNNEQIAQWMQLEIIKNNVGRRLALHGLQVDNFYIDLDSNGHWESCGGKIYLANRLVYSKLINNEWKDFDIQWDLQSTVKSLTFESEFDLTINLVSLEIKNVEFTSYLDVTDYLELKWKLTGTITEYKEFHFDTNNEKISSLTFEIIGPNDRGVKIEGGGVQAQNFYIKWKLLPPGGNLLIGGTIGYNWVDIWGTLNGGSSWIKIWGKN
jgi:hypothetical protein